jgi:hypothetical protein
MKVKFFGSENPQIRQIQASLKALGISIGSSGEMEYWSVVKNIRLLTITLVLRYSNTPK